MLFSFLAVHKPTPTHEHTQCAEEMFAFSAGLHGTSAISANSYIPFRFEVPTVLPLWSVDSRWSSPFSLNLMFDWFIVLLGVPPSRHHGGSSDPPFCARAQEGQRRPDGRNHHGQNLLDLRHESPRQEVRLVFRSCLKLVLFISATLILIIVDGVLSSNYPLGS